MRFGCLLPLLCAIATARRCAKVCAYDPVCKSFWTNGIPSGETWHLVDKWHTEKGCCDFWAWECSLCCDTTDEPTPAPSSPPTLEPTSEPTHRPTLEPTHKPTDPTHEPTHYPFWDPSPEPTRAPTPAPTAWPTEPVPTAGPTVEPSQVPTAGPTEKPSQVPTMSELEKAIKFDEFYAACNESEASSKKWACESFCGAKFSRGKGCKMPWSARNIKCKLLSYEQCVKADCSIKLDKNDHFKKCYGKSQLV